ncbi:hypothetical protein [Lewinella sp. IMCC34191]|uniref:hypothetical protein n=1 Tax=Lewinella sp. IMCC34191 TaxID=2259172 RepID=UPI000E2797F6|nr:hypothetical protein [Lewinella sp. IMCC34191]
MRWSCSILLLFLLSCGRDVPEPAYAFYHWETRLDPPSGPMQTMRTDRVYVKVFDVSWTDGRAEPSALLETDGTVVADLVPVVFITNDVFTHPSGELAGDVLHLLNQRFPYPYEELQVDCDWTAGTRDAYFAFLDDLRQLTGASISCTVRLHQYRDRDRQGIPPVDRAVLMAYNTGDLGSWETENSIVDPRAIDHYVTGQPAYPLPLDLAVATYDWAAVYRRGELAYLINEPNLVALEDSTYFSRLAPLRYRVDSATYYEGLYLYRGDLLRREVADTSLARQVTEDLWPHMANSGSRYVIYYRIGSRQWGQPERSLFYNGSNRSATGSVHNKQ